MKKLLQGIIDFRQRSLRDYQDKFSSLAYGQNPDAFMLACCDSRVVPNVFASCDPGDLFVMRNIGNLLPPCEAHATDVAAALEFAVLALNVTDVIICGHSECGAMKTYMDQNFSAFAHIPEWLRYIEPAYQKWQKNVHDLPLSHLDDTNALSQISVLQQIENIKTYPWIAERLQQRKLRVHGWWFNLKTADVHFHDNIKNEFVILDEKAAKETLNNI